MTRPMSADQNRRAMLAVDRMLTLDEGLYRAARAVGTTRNTVLRWLQENRIGYRKVAYGRYKIEPPMEARVRTFLSNMATGKSASASAKSSGTTLRAMSRQTLPDSSGTPTPIISKVGNRWESNFVPLYDHSIVVYGKLLGLDEAQQGRPGQVAGPKAQRNQKKADEDYADIWWQFDLNNFSSSLSAAACAKYWKPALVQFLREELETPSIANSIIGAKFMENKKVDDHATLNSRLDAAGDLAELTVLEDMMERYDLKLAPVINTGIDDNKTSITNLPDFVAKTDPRITNKINSQGYFQVFYLRKGGLEIYPTPPGLPLTFSYSISDERLA